ncbi:hypothetical protein V6N13_133781 [Hibiscus sabdariffa]
MVVEKNKLRKFEIKHEVVQAQIKSKTRKDKYVACDMLSENVKETIMLTDTYKQYLEYQTPEERTICLNVAT